MLVLRATCTCCERLARMPNPTLQARRSIGAYNAGSNCKDPFALARP